LRAKKIAPEVIIIFGKSIEKTSSDVFAFFLAELHEKA